MGGMVMLTHDQMKDIIIANSVRVSSVTTHPNCEFYVPLFSLRIQLLLWSSFFVTLLAKKYHYSIMQLPLLHAG